MKLASYLLDNTTSWGVVLENELIQVTVAQPSLPTDLQKAIAGWDDVLPLLKSSLDQAPKLNLDEISLAPPVRSPQKIFCVGRNYADHATEQGAEIPTEPVIFNKLPGCLLGHQGTIQIPSQAEQVDYEGELVVVIGTGGRFIAEADAMNHVFGYTCGIDVTARDWQKGRPGGQWLLGKAIDTFAPLGPFIVTADEFSSPLELKVQTRLNGKQMQDGNTDQFLFSIEHLIAHLSKFCRLEPGDLLFTGTPEGVGIARTPPVLLQPGDQIEVEIESIGVLQNSVQAYV